MPPRPKPAKSSRTGPTPKRGAGWWEAEDVRQGWGNSGGNSEGRSGPDGQLPSTTQSTRKAGFDPRAAQGDEPQAKPSSANFTVRGGTVRESRPKKSVHVTSPLDPVNPPQSLRDQAKAFRKASSDENLGDLLRTTYATGGDEKMDPLNEFGYSKAEASNNAKEGGSCREDNKRKTRSTSPRMRRPRADKVRPKCFRSEESVSPPPPPSSPPQVPPQPAGFPSKPGPTVEDKFDEVHKLSMPLKGSIWDPESPNEKAQAQKPSEENTAAKNTPPLQQEKLKSREVGSDADSGTSVSSSVESIGISDPMDIDKPTPTKTPNTAIPARHDLCQSNSHSADSDAHLNTKDLRDTPPLASTNSSGIDNSTNLGSSTPSKSKEASELPSKGLYIAKLSLPQPPKTPCSPNTSLLRKKN